MTMTIRDLTDLGNIINRRLMEMRKSAALTGINTPAEKTIEIEDLTQAISIINLCISQGEDLGDDDVAFLRDQLREFRVTI